MIETKFYQTNPEKMTVGKIESTISKGIDTRLGLLFPKVSIETIDAGRWLPERGPVIFSLERKSWLYPWNGFRKSLFSTELGFGESYEWAKPEKEVLEYLQYGFGAGSVSRGILFSKDELSVLYVPLYLLTTQRLHYLLHPEIVVTEKAEKEVAGIIQIKQY